MRSAGLLEYEASGYGGDAAIQRLHRMDAQRPVQGAVCAICPPPAHQKAEGRAVLLSSQRPAALS